MKIYNKLIILFNMPNNRVKKNKALLLLFFKLRLIYLILLLVYLKKNYNIRHYISSFSLKIDQFF